MTTAHALPKSLAGAPWLIDPNSQAIMTTLHDAGHQARFVGGCVRDSLIDPQLCDVDLDIATSALPEKILGVARKAGLRAVATGLAHGTVSVFVQERRFEITTLRRDVETDGRHATVRFTDSFEADAARRDLTFNAMSCDANGRLFDYFGGRDDLAAGRVRFVGPPAARIAEDYLRILRYFRFLARFGREDPDSCTAAAIVESVDGMARLSAERVQRELKGLLLAPQAGHALRWMARLNVNKAVFCDDVDVDRFVRLDHDGDWIVALAALTRDRIEPGSMTDRLRLSGRDSKLLNELVCHDLPNGGFSSEQARRYLYRHDRRTCLGLLRLAHAEASAFALTQSVALLNATPTPDFPLKGSHLIELDMEPGPAMGELLSAVERWWLDGGCQAPLAACQAEARRRLALTAH